MGLDSELRIIRKDDIDYIINDIITIKPHLYDMEVGGKILFLHPEHTIVQWRNHHRLHRFMFDVYSANTHHTNNIQNISQFEFRFALNPSQIGALAIYVELSSDEDCAIIKDCITLHEKGFVVYYYATS